MNRLASSENNQSFYSIAEFFVPFKTSIERNISLQEEKSNVSLHRIGVKLSYFKILMWCQSICLSCHQVAVLFLTQLAMELPSKKKKEGCSTGIECLISIHLHRGAHVRTYGRSDGSDVITKPNFLTLMGLPKSLSYGPPLNTPIVQIWLLP